MTICLFILKSPQDHMVAVMIFTKKNQLDLLGVDVFAVMFRRVEVLGGGGHFLHDF